MPIISFQKNTDPYGWLGNMSAFPIQYNGKTWRTSEALFQALRYNDQQIQDEIRIQLSPLAAKLKSKKKKHMVHMVVEPLSNIDVNNMRLCLKLKFDQHPELRVKLIQTAGNTLTEDIGKRNKPNDFFWGMKNTPNGWIGQNQLGLLLMELRDGYIRKLKALEN